MKYVKCVEDKEWCVRSFQSREIVFVPFYERIQGEFSRGEKKRLNDGHIRWIWPKPNIYDDV